MKKTLIWIVVTLLVIAGLVYLYNSSLKKGNQYRNGQMSSQYKNIEDNEDVVNNSISNTNNTNNTYTLSDLSTHNTSADCWSTISGKVYDLTSYIYKHPAGPDQILAICGKDGTSLFDDQHGGNMKIEKMLSNFYKGELAK